MKYDVLTEPWITARKKDGTTGTYGIHDLLCSAHDLTEIAESSPHYEFGIYRLLFAFLMDAYRPEDQATVAHLLAEGAFDPTVLDEYIALCRSEGVTFDLFDRERPFLQCGKKEWKADAEIKPIAVLNPAMPSGNNHIHFDHTLACQQSMSCSEAAKAVIAAYLFCTAAAQGYPSSPNGAPPLFCIVKGDSLFETLVFGMVPSNQYDRYDDPPTVWRRTTPIEAKQIVTSTSVLYGMLFPCRRIRLIPECDSDGKLRHTYLEQGANYINYAAWVDPFVAYRENKDGEYVNIKPGMDRESWRDFDSLIHYRNGAPTVVDQFLDITERKHLRMVTFGVVTNQASYLDMSRGEYSISSELARSRDRFLILRETIAEIEQGGGRLNFALQLLQKELKQDGKSGIMAAEAKRTAARYYYSCRHLFLDEICPSLAVARWETVHELLNAWKKAIRQFTLNEYDAFVDRLGASARILMASEVCKGVLFHTQANKAKNGKEKRKRSEDTHGSNK